jgi:hypothetical protein
MWEFSSPDFFFLFINNLKLSKMKKKSMFVKNIRLVLVASLITTAIVSCKKEDITKVTESLDNSISVVDFEDLTVGPKGYVDSIGITNQFDSKNFLFQSVYTGYFSKGFAISTKTDTITEGYLNMYSVFAGIGSAGSKTFIIGTDGAKITCPTKKPALTSIDITNTTYAALSMKNGDGFTKKFAKGDFFKLVINGYSTGLIKNSIEVVLADFSSENTNSHYIQKNWKTIDLSKLSNSDSLVFQINSSQGGVPSFFALDNLKAKY